MLPPLYAHQERSIAGVRRAWLEGARRIVLVLPCGAGKTRTAAEMNAGGLRKGRRMLWVADREELLDQAAKSLGDVCKSLGLGDVGIIKAGRPSNPTAPIQVASRQTLHARPHEMPPADIITSDECHHDAAETRQAIFGRYASPELILGLTATPERGDRQPLGEGSGGIYQRLVVGATVAELQKTLRPDGHPILVGMRVVGPSAYQRELWKPPIKALLDHARRADGSLRPSILFAGSVPEAHEIAEQACSYRIRAAALDGNTPSAKRAGIVKALAAGELDVLVNVNIATEGFDCPRVEVVGVARGCAAESTWIQMIMRAARSSPETGKTAGLLIDFRGLSHVHGLIEDESRTYSLEGHAISRTERIPLSQCGACGSVFAPAETCPQCGAAMPRVRRPKSRVRETKTVEITRDNVTPISVKHQHYLALEKTAREKGYNPKWAGVQFSKRYGHWPQWYRGASKGAA